MDAKKLVVSIILAIALILPTANVSAETNVNLTQDYADYLSNNNPSYEEVKAELGNPDSEEETAGIISGVWTDSNGNMLVVTTGLDGETVEGVIFSQVGNDEFDEVDADLKSAYHNLNFGISYAEAVAKIGAEGTKGASSEANFGEISSESSVYTWMTDDMQVLSLAFLDDGLIAKSLVADGEVLSDYDRSGIPEGEEAEKGNTEDETGKTEDSKSDDNGGEEIDKGKTEDSKGDDGEELSKGNAEDVSGNDDGDSGEEVVKNNTNDESVQPSEEGGKLPKTASPLPLGILGGLGAMILGAVGLRKFR